MAPPKPATPGEIFYEGLKSFDAGVADRWKARSRGDLNFVIDGPDIEAIVVPMIHKGRIITRLQAGALAKLLVEAKFNDAGLAVFKVWITFAQSDGRFDTAADPLVTADELKPINDALGMGAVSAISFVSPGSGLSYAPSGYLAIGKLIATNEILVLEIKISGLEAKLDLPIKANYRSDLNKLFVYQSATPAQKLVTLVHECTHAIQDWRDVRSLMKFTEADAFIAGAIADLSRGTGTISFVGPVIDKAVAAARIVVGGRASAGNTDWTDAYKAVVSEIEKSEDYKDIANIPMRTTQKGEGKREKDEMEVLVTGIEKKQKQDQEDARAFIRWAESKLNMSLGPTP